MSGEIGEKPEPQVDPDPERAPGGPADRFDPDPDEFRAATPDQPRSAQVDDDALPDEVEEPEESGGEESDVDPQDDDPV